jgi:hypothetical protein
MTRISFNLAFKLRVGRDGRQTCSLSDSELELRMTRRARGVRGTAAALRGVASDLLGVGRAFRIRDGRGRAGGALMEGHYDVSRRTTRWYAPEGLVIGGKYFDNFLSLVGRRRRLGTFRAIIGRYRR